MKILDNYKNDLVKSLQTPLLIELNKKDINQFGDDGVNKAALYSQYIYNEFINTSESTNLIFIDADKYDIDNSKDKKIILLEEIINLTSQQIQSQKNINIVKAGIKGALSYFTGPLVKNIIGDYVDAGIDEVRDMLSDSIKDIIDLVGEELNYNFTDKILSKITSNVNKTLNNSTSNMIEEIFSKKLNLSREAKNKLDNLSSQFDKDLTPIGIFSLIIQLLISIAINDEEKKSSNNKLIFINNPHKLDENSLAIFSLLFSFAKDLKEKGKHTGISVVYCYSDDDFQPYQDLKDNTYKISKKLLDEQRRFTQRYAMLERPSSDIPNIAVKSSTFVGREKELQTLKEQFDKSKKDTNLKNIEIIKAEPGIGKTKLVKKHIQEIKDSEKNGQRIIQLTLLNQLGHSSSNTGLSSLKDSILKEARRLETIKTLENTIIKKLKDLVKSKAISTIEGLLGINNIIEIGTSIKDAYDLKNNTNIMLEQSIKDINLKDNKTKEQQFEDIVKAILELKTIAYEGKAFKPFPIILFIDDIQWIDEDSSEFILKYFTKYENIDIHIIATQRASDATTSLKLAKENQSLNPYKISLLQQAGIETDGFVESPENVTKLVTNILELIGLDEKNLIELISLTIDSENKTEDKKQKDELLAKFIIKNLVNENSKDKEYVNTLFAVETINILCDEKLYSSNKNIKEQLILQNPLRYNQSIENFLKILEYTFDKINNKYADAFEHANSDKKFEQQFNLMAYAILEERLHILHEYFGEYGNAAVNTLLLSSLLGAPFSSDIVKNVIEAISTTEEPLLEPLKKEFTKQSSNILEALHYQIIEEVYEILSRYIPINRAYSYKHNLLEIYLDKQFEYKVYNIYKEYNEKSDILEVKEKLFDLIIKVVEEEEIKQNYFTIVCFDRLELLDDKQINHLFFIKNILYKIISLGININNIHFSEKYYQISKSLSNINKFFYNWESARLIIDKMYERMKILKNDISNLIYLQVLITYRVFYSSDYILMTKISFADLKKEIDELLCVQVYSLSEKNTNKELINIIQIIIEFPKVDYLSHIINNFGNRIENIDKNVFIKAKSILLVGIYLKEDKISTRIKEHIKFIKKTIENSEDKRETLILLQELYQGLIKLKYDYYKDKLNLIDEISIIEKLRNIDEFKLKDDFLELTDKYKNNIDDVSIVLFLVIFTKTIEEANKLYNLLEEIPSSELSPKIKSLLKNYSQDKIKNNYKNNYKNIIKDICKILQRLRNRKIEYLFDVILDHLISIYESNQEYNDILEFLSGIKECINFNEEMKLKYDEIIKNINLKNKNFSKEIDDYLSEY